MNTDKQLFQLFAVHPQWLYELAGLPPPGKCELRSFTVKALERRTDGLIVPADLRLPLRIVEFQLALDGSIYRRTVTEMIAAQAEFGGRSVRGMIFFGSRRCDPKTEPWTKIVDSFLIDDVVARFQKSHPKHPLSAVFQPLVESDNRVLESTAVEHFRTIRNSSLPKQPKEVLSMVFLDWLTQRFPTMTKDEVEIMMLGKMTPLEETVCGKELIEMGLSQGLSQGVTRSVIRVADARFGQVPKTVQSRIRKLSLEQSERLLDFLTNCQSLAELRDWLSDELQ